MTADAEYLAAVIEAGSDPARRAAVLTATHATPTKPRMGTIRECAAIVGTCSRTVERYARQGLIPRVHLSARMVRYDLAAAERLATRGAEAALGARC